MPAVESKPPTRRPGHCILAGHKRQCLQDLGWQSQDLDAIDLQDQWLNALAMLYRCMSLAAMAALLSVHYTTIGRDLRAMGVEIRGSGSVGCVKSTRRPPINRLDTDDPDLENRKEAIRLYNSGRTMEAIARIMGVSITTIDRWLFKKFVKRAPAMNHRAEAQAMRALLIDPSCPVTNNLDTRMTHKAFVWMCLGKQFVAKVPRCRQCRGKDRPKNLILI